MSIPESIQIAANLATVATAFGVFLAWYQILTARQMSKTEFEDELTQQYREIIKEIPVGALLGKEISEEEWNSALDDFYRYIDLSNEQVFLRLNARVRSETWWLWRDGIRTNLGRPAFKKAWQHFKHEAPNDFKELQLLEEEEYLSDPREWRKDFRDRVKSLQEKREKLLHE